MFACKALLSGIFLSSSTFFFSSSRKSFWNKSNFKLEWWSIVSLFSGFHNQPCWKGWSLNIPNFLIKMKKSVADSKMTQLSFGLFWNQSCGIFSGVLGVILSRSLSNNACPEEESPTGKETIASQANFHFSSF